MNRRNFFKFMYNGLAAISMAAAIKLPESIKQESPLDYAISATLEYMEKENPPKLFGEVARNRTSVRDCKIEIQSSDGRCIDITPHTGSIAYGSFGEEWVFDSKIKEWIKTK